mmetsp:Transcript_23378/g.50027  ORF Transcript_23378/g.50027 Transcript_23378/m.50027 type:complete len:511 (+) Transcript_23378:80-1612(+)
MIVHTETSNMDSRNNIFGLHENDTPIQLFRFPLRSTHTIAGPSNPASKPALADIFPVYLLPSAPGVTLHVELQAHDVVEPVRGQVEHVPWLHHDLVHVSLQKRRKLFQVGIAPVHGRVTRRGMSAREEVHVDALARISQYVPPLAAQQRDGVPRQVEVILGDDTPHAEPAVYPLLVRRLDEVERAAALVVLLPGLEERQLVEQPLGGSLVAAPVLGVVTHGAAPDQAEVPVGIVRPEFVVGHVGVLQPVQVGHAQVFRGGLPICQRGLLLVILRLRHLPLQHLHLLPRLVVVLVVRRVSLRLLQPCLQFVELLYIVHGLPHRDLISASEAVVNLLPVVLHFILERLRGRPALILRPLVHPVHEVIVRAVLRPPHRVLVPHEQLLHVARVVPPFGGASDGGIVPHDERPLPALISGGLAQIGAVVEHADALVNFRVLRPRGIVGGPVARDVEHGPLHGISLRRVFRAVVNIIGRLSLGRLPVQALTLSLGLDELQGSLVVFGKDLRVVFPT